MGAASYFRGVLPKCIVAFIRQQPRYFGVTIGSFASFFYLWIRHKEKVTALHAVNCNALRHVLTERALWEG